MALAKVCGIETEYGIVVRGGDNNPVSASSLLINAYLAAVAGDRDQAAPQRVDWDFDDEQPTNDARGYSLDPALAPEVETTLVNAVLTNGARFYVDHAHPEISSPEVRDAREAVVWDRAADEIVRRAMTAARSMLPDAAEIIVHKNNSDGKGNSYGCHENYLLARELPFGRLTRQITPHFVTRQVFAGAGKVGCELPGRPHDDIGYQLSQRADFFEEEVGLETTLKRPIVNTRDEPHADAQKYRRLHVIVGDANMSEVATYLKVGTTAIVLAMIEDDELGDDLTLAHPVPAMRQVSHDPSLRQTVQLANGQRATALEIQWDLFERARKYEQVHGLESVGIGVGADVLDRWESVLSGLESDPDSVADRVDWVAKRRLVRGIQERHGLEPASPRLKAIDLQYHDLRPERCLATRVGMQTMVGDDEARRAMVEPPSSTRAYFRGRCLAKFADDIVAANWDSLVFDIGRDPLRRVPMMEPLRGTADHVGTLIDQSETARVLLDRLGESN
ncbi:depupylase/deamidase Dop [Ilumatobacter nonamiensis]|uniref:depupylase/deamidase Dop n=1 Tax=Ilumatobacter nonamiensis TaxID=467093 RepID=UPI000347A877|nr:depupylase/deamidase Dop [Ilumatobacter nonamiensis]